MVGQESRATLADSVPLRNLVGQALPVSEDHLRQCAVDSAWVARTRAPELGDLGWFMKVPAKKNPGVAEATARTAAQGAFWEGRFQDVAVLDDGALLAVAAYIDLNPLRRGRAETPRRFQAHLAPCTAL